MVCVMILPSIKNLTGSSLQDSAEKCRINKPKPIKSPGPWVLLIRFRAKKTKLLKAWISFVVGKKAYETSEYMMYFAFVARATLCRDSI